MKHSLVIAMVIPLLATPATAGAMLKTLPLQRGYYVAADTPCGAASATTLVLVRRAGIGNEQGFDRFKRVEKIGTADYRVTTDRINSDGDVDGASVSEYVITSSSSFRQKNEFGAFAMRFCPQNRLPDPWRANNIEALIR